MAQPIMNALDAIAGSQASAYITLADGNRYCFMQLYTPIPSSSPQAARQRQRLS